MGTAVAAVLQLPLPERIEAVKAIWESIATDPASATLPLSEAQLRELGARLDADERDPQAGASWEVVRERVRRSR